MDADDDPTPFDVDHGDTGTTVGPEIVVAVLGAIVLLIGLVSRHLVAIAVGLAGVAAGVVLARR